MKTKTEIIKQKRKLFNILLVRTHQMDAKDHILAGQGVESTKELTESQLDDLISWANSLINDKHEQVSKEVRSWRSKCLRIMKDCGVNTQDWSAVNRFMLDSRVCGKHLYELKTVAELKKLHRKLHSISENIQKRLADEQMKMMCN